MGLARVQDLYFNHLLNLMTDCIAGTNHPTSYSSPKIIRRQYKKEIQIDGIIGLRKDKESLAPDHIIQGKAF